MFNPYVMPFSFILFYRQIDDVSIGGDRTPFPSSMLLDVC